VGKRGRRRRQGRENHHKRRAQKLHKVEGENQKFHKRMANLISSAVILAAVFSTVCVLAYSRGSLPFDYMDFIYVQWTIFIIFGMTVLFIYWNNKKCPVYREAFWMIVIYNMVMGAIVGGIG
jgi:hypothetical protein